MHALRIIGAAILTFSASQVILLAQNREDVFYQSQLQSNYPRKTSATQTAHDVRGSHDSSATADSPTRS
jgi:hypothetical protein